MKELTLFQCELCMTQFAKQKDAEKCEASHKMPVKFTDIKYRSYKSNPKGYPDYITIEFDDGTKVKYKNDGNI